MKLCADRYYQNLTSSISSTKKNQWETEILNAEQERLTDRKSMDILKARPIDLLPGTHADHHPSSASFNHENSIENWISMGLEIEERQYSYSYCASGKY